MAQKTLALFLLPQELTVCRLDPGAALPDWATGGAVWSATRTPDELSIVCAVGAVPDGVQAVGPWRALRVAGPLDFALVGILSAIAAPLAAAGVSIFAVSTYDTDYILVRDSSLAQALAALRGAGHQVEESAGSC